MKKFIFVILAVMLVLSVTASVFADAVYTGGPDARVKIYTKAETGGGTLSSTVTAGNTILGFSYTDSAAGVGAILDVASVATGIAAISTYLVSEIKVAAGGNSITMFPFPYPVVRGLVVSMTTATGCISVYYQ